MKFFVIGAFALMIAACSSTAEKKSTSDKIVSTEDFAPQPDTATRFTGNQQTPSKNDKVPDPDWDRKILRTANVSVEIRDAKAYYAKVREQVRRAGGYISGEEQSQDEYRIGNAMIIKVPVQAFEDVVAALAEGVEKLNEKKVTSQDVSGEYMDVQARMEAKKNVRERYYNLLNQAKNMEEILSIQRETKLIQEEIESANGRIAFMGNASVFSTIHLNYYQVINPTIKAPGHPGLGARFANAFKSGWGWMEELFVALVSVWPLWLGIACILAVLRRRKIA